ncbi:SRPBCC domain-containing protein [Peribacillus frigoritolerans]|uniref:SRPBCC domain-containing protein n=1 Tax=Peribacillus frigoritolerans TaxID=450367 RepID=UPI0027D32104|nr:SRPBCC domain-containing protein [Peribacillus frigoritolerans]
MFPKTEITRSFNAPRELVFKAFTESEHLQNWWGPKGWAFDISKLSFARKVFSITARHLLMVM